MESPGLALAAGVVAGAAGAACIMHWQKQKQEKQLVRRSSSEKVQCNEFATTPSALLPTMQRVSTVIRDELPEQQVDRKIVYLVRHAQAAHNILEKAAKDAVKRAAPMQKRKRPARPCSTADNFDARSLSKSIRRRASRTSWRNSSGHAPTRRRNACSSRRSSARCGEPPLPRSPENGGARAAAGEAPAGARRRRPAAEAQCSSEYLVRILAAHGTWPHGTRSGGLLGNAEVEERAATLLELLRGREEHAIAVVTHKGYLRELNKGTLVRLPAGRCNGGAG